MTKMIIGAEELFPFWEELRPGHGTEIDVDRKTAVRWRKTMDDFYQVQAEMKAALDAALTQTS